MTPLKPKRVLEVVMKACPVCGLDVEDSYLFCPDDGARLVDAWTTDAVPSTPLVEAQPEIAQLKPSDNASNEDVVGLYCGECAAEYPITFVECPVHHASLTKYKTPPPVTGLAVAVKPDQELPSQVDGGTQTFVEPPAELPAPVASELPETFEPARVDLHELREASPMAAPSLAFTSIGESPKRRGSKTWSPSLLGFDDSPGDYAADEPGPAPISRYDTKSFRVVAATIVIGLVLFCVVAVYTFFSASGRRKAIARAARPAATTDVVEQPAFIPTPDDARNFAPEQAQPPATDNDPQAAQPAQSHTAPALPTAAARAQKAESDSRSLAAETRPKPSQTVMDRSAQAPSPGVSAVREPVLPRGAPGIVDARVLRVRSIKTDSGVRYDLTFDLQDESGRHAQWERMLISTRSASGISRTRAVPFVHRLGANGALTFTVSVEMRGQSEPDWNGRVVCTTTGSDNDGRPLRASFGASVAHR